VEAIEGGGRTLADHSIAVKTFLVHLANMYKHIKDSSSPESETIEQESEDEEEESEEEDESEYDD